MAAFVSGFAAEKLKVGVGLPGGKLPLKLSVNVPEAPLSVIRCSSLSRPDGSPAALFAGVATVRLAGVVPIGAPVIAGKFTPVKTFLNRIWNCVVLVPTGFSS